jgi:hypothetical protein
MRGWRVAPRKFFVHCDAHWISIPLSHFIEGVRDPPKHVKTKCEDSAALIGAPSANGGEPHPQGQFIAGL